MSIEERARAKINLTLRVLGRRPDGYHELESLVTFADVADTVTLSLGLEPSITTAGPFASAIEGENLLQKTLGLVARSQTALRVGAVHLQKNLPVAAGLGGGSADAGALLRALRRAHAERGDEVPWRDIAARIGADVPVCLGDRPALMRGIGDVLLERGSSGAYRPLAAVLVNPGAPLSTAAVFRALAASRHAGAAIPPPNAFDDIEQLIAYCRAHGNDLESAATALLPPIAEAKTALAAHSGCRFAAMSGSGPTCFGIFTSAQLAHDAAAAIAKARAGWWVVATRLDWPG